MRGSCWTLSNIFGAWQCHFWDLCALGNNAHVYETESVYEGCGLTVAFSPRSPPPAPRCILPGTCSVPSCQSPLHLPFISLEFYLPRSLLDWLFLVSLDSAQMFPIWRTLSKTTQSKPALPPHSLPITLGDIACPAVSMAFITVQHCIIYCH